MRLRDDCVFLAEVMSCLGFGNIARRNQHRQVWTIIFDPVSKTKAIDVSWHTQVR